MPLHYVDIDPDGTQGDAWLYVIVEAKTGVVYGVQCACLSCAWFTAEGYLVPIWGAKTNAEEGDINPAELTACFHDSMARAIHYVDYWQAISYMHDRLDELEAIVRTIPYWTTDDGTESGNQRRALQLDRDRLDELAEAWVPVRMSDGRGILIWKNCD